MGTPSITDPKAAKNGSFLEKEFLSKEVSGRKVELDEVIVPAPELESSSSQKSVPVIPTPISEEVNDDDHETSDQVTTEPHRSTRVRSALEWYDNPALEVMLLDHDKPTNYEEVMMSPESAKTSSVDDRHISAPWGSTTMVIDSGPKTVSNSP